MTKKIAVFDRFYTEDAHWGASDVVAEALEPERHRVVTHSNGLRRAALALLAIKNGEIEVPDVVIVGGRLEDSHIEYIRDPVTFPSPVSVEGRNLVRRRTVTEKDGVTHLLPIVGEAGAVRLPVSEPGPISGIDRHEFNTAYTRRRGVLAPAAYILSHLTRVMLPETPRIIAISGLTDLSHLPVDAFIDRNLEEDPSRHLREEIDR